MGSGTVIPSDESWLNDPRRVLRGVAAAAMAGGVFTAISIAVPHDNTTYDGEYLAMAVVVFVFGMLLRVWSHSAAITPTSVHIATGVFSIWILGISWYGMVDVGGVQAIFLVVPLMITTSFGPLRWSIALLTAQSIGYAVVLQTSDTVLGLDRLAQWVVITAGLIVALIYKDLMRRQLAAASAAQVLARAEQEALRRAHAHKLELVNAELANANEMKSRFVAMASHELRTPLTAISGFAMTMVDRWSTLSDDEKLQFVGIIEEQSGRLGRLVSDLLTMSRIEDGRVDARPVPVAVGAVVTRTMQHLGLVDVVVTCDADVVVLADADHVEQILVNLIGNAAAYGAAPISVDATYEDADWVRINVTDEGVGVSAEFEPHLFVRFARAPENEHAGHEFGGGTGLGLSIVEGLANAYGGTVWYEPNQPHGSMFCVRLPAAG